jgi:hypothetical protein
MTNEKTLVQVAQRIADNRESEENMAAFGKLAMLAIAVGLVLLFLKGPFHTKKS